MTVAPLPAARFADFVPPALLAGLVCGFALGLPFVEWLTCLCCAPVILCGLWAAYLLSRRLGPTGTPFLVVHGALAGALAGLVCGFALGLPFVGVLTCLCCAPVIVCGLWAAYLLSRRLGPTGTPFLVVHGAVAGALAGIVCGVTSVIVGSVCKAVFGDPGRKFVEDMLRNMSSMPPETRQALDEAFSRGMSVAMFFLALIFTPLIYAAFAALGGALGGLWFKPKTPPLSPASTAPIDISPAGGGQPPINA